MANGKASLGLVNQRAAWRRAIRHFCNVWLVANKRAEKTIRGYQIDLVQFTRQLPQSCGLRSVTRGMVEKWVARLQKENYERSSICRKLASLRALFGYLRLTRQVSKSPLQDLRISLGPEKRLTRVVPRDDVRSIVRIVDQNYQFHARSQIHSIRRLLKLRDAIIIRVLCLTGVRVGELVALHCRDVVHHSSALLITGKGSRERLAFLPDTRTKALIVQYLCARRRYFPSETSLFIGTDGSPLSTDSIRRILGTLSSAAKLSRRVTPHMLRHTAATSFLENGADLRVVQEFLGHGSIRSTERYTHITGGFLLSVLRKAHPLKRVA